MALLTHPRLLAHLLDVSLQIKLIITGIVFCMHIDVPITGGGGGYGGARNRYFTVLP